MLRGSPLAQRQAHAQRLVNAPVPFVGCVLKRDGEVLACGQFAIEGDLVGLYDVFTAPAARGQGLARLLCSQLLAACRVTRRPHGLPAGRGRQRRRRAPSTAGWASPTATPTTTARAHPTAA